MNGSGSQLAAYDAGAIAPMSQSFVGEVVAGGGAMTRTGGQYSTAITVQRPRNLQHVVARLEQEADLCGDDFFYGWGTGKDRVEGPSVKLALAAARCYGNCVIEQQPVVETATSYIFSATFIDLETGYTLTRQFRQSKTWKVHGKFDEDRKADIRFQIGQSKAIRNVVLNAVPSGLVNRAVERAKAGMRAQIEARVKAKGIVAAIEGAMSALSKAGVPEKLALAKFGVAKREALSIDDLTIMAGDIKAIQTGQAWASELYPDESAEEQQTPPSNSLNDRLLGNREPSSSQAPSAPPASEDVASATHADASESSKESPVREQAAADAGGGGEREFVDYAEFYAACESIAAERGITNFDAAMKALPLNGYDVKASRRTKALPEQQRVYAAMRDGQFDWAAAKIIA